MIGAKLFCGHSTEQVICIACGEKFDKGETYEYDKYGNPWCRQGRDFERVCKPCYREYCHQTRHGLEKTLIAADAGQTDRETFLRQFCELMAEETEAGRQ